MEMQLAIKQIIDKMKQRKKKVGIYMVIMVDGRRLTSKEYYRDRPKDKEVVMIIDNNQNRLKPYEYRNS